MIQYNEKSPMSHKLSKKDNLKVKGNNGDRTV